MISGARRISGTPLQPPASSGRILFSSVSPFRLGRRTSARYWIVLNLNIPNPTQRYMARGNACGAIFLARSKRRFAAAAGRGGAAGSDGRAGRRDWKGREWATKRAIASPRRHAGLCCNRPGQLRALGGRGSEIFGAEPRWCCLKLQFEDPSTWRATLCAHERAAAHRSLRRCGGIRCSVEQTKYPSCVSLLAWSSLRRVLPPDKALIAG
jgi:hypothetical protein